MKSFLTASTALAAIAFAMPAMANGHMHMQDALPGIDVTVGGEVNAYGGFIDNDVARDSDSDILGEGKLSVSASGAAGPQISYGAEVQMMANTDEDVNVDRAWLWVGTPFAKLHFGDNEGAAGLLRVGAPNLGAGTLNSDDNGRAAYWKRFAGREVLPGDSAFGDTSTKMTAVSEPMHGFQAGASYTPTLDAGDNVLFERDSENFFEVAGKYHTVVDGIGLHAGVGMSTGEILEENVTGWNLGAGATWQGLEVGGSYAKVDIAGVEIDEYAAGVTYNFDKYSVGANYALVQGVSEEDAVYSVGAMYHLTENFSVHSDIGMIDPDVGDKTTVATAGLRVKF